MKPNASTLLAASAGILVTMVHAGARADATKAWTPGVLVAVNELFGDRSGWSWAGTSDPAPGVVGTLVPRLGVTQMVSVGHSAIEPCFRVGASTDGTTQSFTLSFDADMLDHVSIASFDGQAYELVPIVFEAAGGTASTGIEVAETDAKAWTPGVLAAVNELFGDRSGWSFAGTSDARRPPGVLATLVPVVGLAQFVTVGHSLIVPCVRIGAFTDGSSQTFTLQFDAEMLDHFTITSFEGAPYALVPVGPTHP